ncbi:MAG: CBS domain-containing protein, partial [Rhodospirillales bacterium]|nr:CBS domain-containing protein [Rhodospirillales bacterium]
DFHVLHPGGKLGRQLLRVADIMHVGDALPLVGRDTHMAEALITMTAKSFGCVGVGDEGGALAGIVTDGDLRRHMSPDLMSLNVTDIMTQGATTIRADALVSEALHVMNGGGGRPITNLFVVDDGKPVGIIHIHDCLRVGVA